MRKHLTLVSMLALLLFGATAHAQYQIGDQVTDDFTLQDVHGESHSLSDYQGQCVLINFFATW